MVKDTRDTVSGILDRHHIADYRWIDPHQIVVAQWVRMKCTFGCGDYGRNASCPPYTPSVADCRRFFDEYSLGAVLHFQHSVDKPEDRHEWSTDVNAGLTALERDVFLAGFPKVFLLFMDTCGLCKKCAGTRDECKRPKEARPTPEAMAMDVFSTVRPLGFPIDVLNDYSQAMNRYAFLLIE